MGVSYTPYIAKLAIFLLKGRCGLSAAAAAAAASSLLLMGGGADWVLSVSTTLRKISAFRNAGE